MNDVCTGCGEPNPPGTQFCLFCGIYLGWEDSDGERSGAAAPRASAATATGDTSDDPDASDHTRALEIDRTQTMAPAAAWVAATRPPPAARERHVAPVAPPVGACPSCGQVNDPSRRFCGRCGTVLSVGAPVHAPAPARRSWWQRLLRSDTRVARRAYRRSLPALYRWRRVAIVTVLALVVGGTFAAVRRDPVRFAMDRWYDITNTLEPVQTVTARAVDVESVDEDNAADHVLDADPLTAWVTDWSPPAEPVPCGSDPADGIVLTFPATRVRELQVITGVTDPSARQLQHVPTQLQVVLPDGTCRPVDLGRQAEVQTVPFDTEEPVTRLTFIIGAAHTADDPRVVDLAALSQLTLLARPTSGR